MYDVCIIGAGAAGMMCGVVASERGLNVCIVEKNPAPGKKIYATGNGRCNISNVNCENANDVLAFFRSLGLVTVTEEQGRVYPASSQAADVVYVLEKRLKVNGVRIEAKHACDWVEKTGDGFEVCCGHERIRCAKLVVATGGKAAPIYGTTGDGYGLAQSLGHTVRKPVPVLTGIECDYDMTKLKGTRAGAVCSLTRHGEEVFREKGEVQFTEYGLSGICIFNMSRHLLLDERTSFGDYTVSLDFSCCSDRSKVIESILTERSAIKGFRNRDLLVSMVPRALAEDIVKRTGLVPDEPATGSLDVLRALAMEMAEWKTGVTGARGWKMAQCTKGGVAVEEIDPDTMESVISPGLFFAGEVLDYDGPCGGYNLQHAWETGMRAGRNV